MKTQLEKDEEVVMISKKHWIYYGMPIVATVIMFFFAIFIDTIPRLSNISVYLLIFPALLGFYSLYAFFNREYDIWVITNKRIIDEWGIITQNSKETPIDKIQNVSVNQTVLGKILGFGDVRIQTAATQGAVVYKMVEEPNRLKESITLSQESYQKEKTQREAERLAEAMVKSMQAKEEGGEKSENG